MKLMMSMSYQRLKLKKVTLRYMKLMTSMSYQRLKLKKVTLR